MLANSVDIEAGTRAHRYFVDRQLKCLNQYSALGKESYSFKRYNPLQHLMFVKRLDIKAGTRTNNYFARFAVDNYKVSQKLFTIHS